MHFSIHVLMMFTCWIHAASNNVDSAHHTYVTMGEGRDWFVLDQTTDRFEQLLLPPNSNPKDVAVSPDGRLVAFTSTKPGRPGQARLFVWTRHSHDSPHQIGENAGYYSDPVFSPNAAWIYVAHNALGLGSPMRHSAAAFAQIYRIRPDGSGIQRLTSGSGCHFAPTFDRSGVALWIHATCTSPLRSIERDAIQSPGAKPLLTLPSSIDELQLSRDGTRALVSTTGQSTISIEEIDLTKGDARILSTYIRDSMRARPHYSADERNVYFIRRHKPWVLNRKHPASAHPLRDARLERQ